MKKITLIILFFLIQFCHPLVYGSDEDEDLTGGFYKIKYKGEGKNKEWVYLFKDKNMKELYKDFLRDTTNGVPFNEKLRKIILQTFNAGINHQLEKLKGCMGGDYSKKIETKEKTGEIYLRFDDDYGTHDGYHGYEKENAKENVTLSGSYLEKIIKDITSSIKNNEKWYPFNIYTLPWYKDFLTDIGHEMIHTHAGIGGGHMGECIAHCFTRQCLNSKHDPRNFQYSVVGSVVTNPLQCDQLEFPSETKNTMGEGKCFCGVNWENHSDNKPCEDNNQPPPQSSSGYNSSGTTRTVTAYLPDPPDDHYSYSDFAAFSDDEINSNYGGNYFEDAINDSINFSFYPDILIYNKYGTSLMGNLLDRIMPGNYFDDYTHDYFSTNHKILVIPSAALIGDSESEIVKQAIMKFLEGNRSVVLLSQQFGADVENLILSLTGEKIKAVGFREDSSCLKNSVYIAETGMHPILSSSTSGILDVGIDGYATVGIGSNATVLLRRKANAEPALLYFKYGNSTIYLFFGFTDYSNSRSMASVQELKLVKNMLRHAMAPDDYIPIFNLEENPNPTISLNIQACNRSEKPAAKAKISVYTIDNTPVYETEVSVSLNPGESADIPITFTLPDLESKDYGIGFTVYELKDSESNLIQLKTETPTGRFSIYKLLNPANINDGLYRWITVDDEIAYWGEDIECKIHLKNTSHQVKQLEVNNPYFQINHTSNYIGFESFSAAINPDETYEHVVYLSTKDISLMGDEKVTFRIKYRDSEGNLRQLSAAKAVFVKKALTQSTLELNNSYAVAPGGSLDYSLHSFSDLAIAGETTVKLALERYNRENSTYVEIETLFQGTHDYSVNGDFQYTGTHTPETVYPSGQYRLKLEVTAPNGVKELTRYQDFFYDRSGFRVTPGSVKPLRWLVPGETYTIPLYVRNISSNNDYHVTNGLCILRLLSPGNQEIFRKEITNINIAAEARLDLTETFVFNPVETGDYTLEYAYEDETFSDNLRFRKAQVLYYWPSFSVTPDKPGYNYMDTANIAVKVNGLGSYTIQCQCPEAGLAETRSVQIPDPGIPAAEVFQVPLGMSSYYHVHVQVIDAANKSLERTIGLYVKPIQLDYWGNFNDTIARAGLPLEFDAHIKGISGFSIPLTGELTVSAPGLNYEEKRSVTIQPTGDNIFNYTIPIDASVPSGIYDINAGLKINGMDFINKQHFIPLPGAELTLSKPGTTYNAGDSITFTLDNVGGKTGTFAVEILLKDALGNPLEQVQETRTIEPGANSSLTFSIPGNLKTGYYTLVQRTEETTAQESGENENTFPLQITGLSTSLHSYTLKEKYFDDEEVSGKSEISPGNGDIANGSLLAEIVKIEDNKGIEKIYDWVNCITVDSQKRLWVGTDVGVSRYEDGSWQEYTQLPDTTPMGMVLDITAGPGDKIYSLTFDGIVVMADNGAQVSEIPFYSSYHDWHLDILAVDQLSRIWMIYIKESDFLIYNAVYYDETGWHIYVEEEMDTYTQTIHSDGSGGVWVVSPYSLTHIKPDLSLEGWDSYSGLPIDDIFFSDVDTNGVVWFNSESTGKLYSFDRSTMGWTDYSIKPGYPLRMAAVRGDDSGNIYGIGTTENYRYSVYRYQDNEFIGGAVEFDTWTYGAILDLAVVDGNVYINGGFGSSSGEGNEEFTSGLLKISALSGTGPQVLWSQTYTIDASAGSGLTLDLNPGTTFDPGVYILKTRLFSSLEQFLAGSSDTFTVRDSDVSVSLFANCSANGFVKTGTPVPVTIEVLNNTPESKSNLEYMVKKVSPAGSEEVILSQPLTLAPGQLETAAITFNETTIGTWKIKTDLNDNSSGEPVVLSSSELVIGVAEPTVTMEITTPPYAGDESFDVNIKLVNQGNIPVELAIQASIESIPQPLLQETFILNPLEERVLTLNDTISADRTYTISLTGDIEKSETRTVKYGYVENFSLNIQPAYREGQVSIGYTLANGGGLPFTDQVHFQLFPVGGTPPLYTTERNYHLYPDQAPMVDTIDIPLFPGNYQLNYHTSKQPQVQTALFVVQPSGIGNIVIDPSGQYPVGAADITFSITNIDTFAGQVPVTITLLGSEPGVPLLTETRDYYLLPGETQNDVLHHEFAGVGDYTLNFTGAKLPAPINSIIRVMNLEQVTANLSIGQLETDKIPVNVLLENSGYQAFTGTAVIEVDGIRHEEIIDVSQGSSFDGTVELNTSVLTPGSKEVKAYLYDNAGSAIAQTTGTVIVQPANIKLTQYPENLEINAGSFGEVTLTLKNQGNLRGEAVLKINTFDTLYQEREVVLEPGEEIQLGDIFIQAPPDLPTGSYPFYYSLKGSGVENGSSAGNFNFKVNGLSLDIDASLDRSLYNPGETAALTLNITAGTASDAPLEAVVNWGIFSETRQFNLSSGSASLVFDIPLDQAREEKVFYGIYHEGGKGLHLNDIYLYFRGEISVETDKQVYAPGEIVHAVFTGEHSGVLTVSAFDESYTLDFSSSASAGFQAPADTLGGTYGISWSLIPSDPSKPELSGSHPFDVSGLVVKVAKSELEKGKYAPGDTVNAHYIFESNRDQTLKLRNWVVMPSGDWTFLGESSVTVSSQQQVDAMSGYSFSTTEAGTHELVYGLYQPEGCENCDKLVVSGRLSFDVGNAVLLGINTDQWEYKTGDEPVTLKIDYFGEGFSQLQVYLDEENVHQQGLTLSGTGSTVVIMQSSSISGGSHRIKALLIQDNLTSSKSTGFTYGTHLPDLTAWLTDTLQDGLNYSFKLEVSNTGQTAGTASSLVFSDNGMNVGTASIPALPPSQSYEVIFNWNGSGKAGSHELLFEVDSSDAVKEFSETNNSMEFTLEVPALFYSLETDPPEKLIYPANTPINMITRLINNQETPILLTLDLSITNEDSGATIHNQTKEEQIPAFGSKTITDTFNTGVYPAGNYTARGALFEKTAPLDPPQKLFIGEGSDSVDMFRELFLFFEPTKIVSGSLQIQPQQIPAKTPTEVQLSMTLKNAGNVPLEDEILLIDVFNTDLGEVVISEEFSLSIPLAEEITETKTMSLNLVEGNYEIWLKHHEEILALAELSAISAVKPSQTIAIYPRVLIMNLLPPAARGALFEKTAPLDPPQKLLIDLLQSQGIEYEVGFRLLDSYVKLNKSQANVNIVFGNKIGRNLRDELKEKVWHGEGLILFCDTPAQNHEWIDFPGVTIKPIPGKNRETVIRILPNEFCNAGEIELQGKIRFRMVKHQGDVVIIAQTQQKKYPVITYRKYGKGHILILIKSFCGGSRGAGFSKRAPLELFLNAITRFSQDIYTGTDLTRLLPLELTLKNESSEAKTVKIKTFLPYGVEAFDFQPEPEEGEELKWTITIPAVSTETISYWIKLPDQVNSFEIRTELYDEETKLDEVSTAFEVTQTVLFRINELILELDMINASGKDTQLVRKAKHHLEQIRNRSGDSFMVHLLNLHDSVKAASYLGEIKRVDVLNQWLKTQDIMIIMGRRFYEAVKTWGEVQYEGAR